MFIDYEGVLKEDINWYNDSKSDSRVIGWWSGGVASAITCYLGLQKYENIELFMTDTGQEDTDTYRFLCDYEKVLGVKVNVVKSLDFDSPEDVWDKYLELGFAKGAPCSRELKRNVRKTLIENIETDYSQLFGFDFCKKEINRARNMASNNTELNPKFPLIEEEMNREAIFAKLKYLGIEPPRAYKEFSNNNCLGDPDSPKGGCVLGGIGYWQKIQEIYPHKFEYMANKEQELTAKKGKPVYICRDQRGGEKRPLFLKHNSMYPEIGTISEIKGRRPVGFLSDCNGFCDTN